MSIFSFLAIDSCLSERERRKCTHTHAHNSGTGTGGEKYRHVQPTARQLVYSQTAQHTTTYTQAIGMAHFLALFASLSFPISGSGEPNLLFSLWLFDVDVVCCWSCSSPKLYRRAKKKQGMRAWLLAFAFALLACWLWAVVGR